MTATEQARGDNPRWVAALATALPVALAVAFVLWLYPPGARHLPAAPVPAAAGPMTDPDLHTTVARAR